MPNPGVEVRNLLINKVKKELIGPGSETENESEFENEIISEDPILRYSLGILYPQNYKFIEPEPIDNTNCEETLTDVEGGQYIEDENEEFEQILNSSNNYNPSAYGITFILKNEVGELKITVNAARYQKLTEHENLKNTFQTTADNIRILKKICNKVDNIFEITDNGIIKINNTNDETKKLLAEFDVSERKVFWDIYNTIKNVKNIKDHYFKRIPNTIIKNVKIDSIEKYDKMPLSEGLELRVNKRRINNDINKITLSICNVFYKGCCNDGLTDSFYQNELTVQLLSKENSFLNFKNIHIANTFDKADELLFRNKKIFAVGHGCSVNWNNEISEIKTTFMPTQEIPMMEFNILDGESKFLDLKFLCDKNITKIEKINELKKLVNHYITWIENKKSEVGIIEQELKEVADLNLSKCFEVVERINESIRLLEKDENVFQAFSFMNEAMLIQRYHSDLINKCRQEGIVINKLTSSIDYLKEIDFNIYKWRAFQIAFILMVLESIVNPKSEYRDVADLIWFPTGGGKTEAYLGALALSIFYRRIKDKASNFKNSGGTSAIMRYTLRLLTTQQFQRASTFICACEKIRKNNERYLGFESITIGLWVGIKNTPNTIDDASKKIKELLTSKNGQPKNYFQISCCPWCGSSLINLENNEIGFKKEIKRKFYIKCLNKNCEYSNILPVQVVDEMLYENPPTLLIATIDKFALLVKKEKARAFFGLGNNNLPPELIIQDELHLISGPLGSMFGIYESVFDYLCQNNGSNAKIISSTATIKQANVQIKNLFHRNSFLFPPPGIEIEDSFFAKEKKIDENNLGRLYCGIINIGITASTAIVRILATLLYYNIEFSRFIQKEEIFDYNNYYTIVGYFNSLKELGIASSLLADDVEGRYQQIEVRNGFLIPREKKYCELTSRLNDDEIPKILYELETTTNYSIVLASNMLSVGIDISKLNIMFMQNQPKSNSEYIQATSRVGRQVPGVIFTLYNYFRPRDKSYFENFKSFHQSFYRFVEPTSATPFSLPARKKALHSIIIILMRIKYNIKCTDFLNKKNDLVTFKDYLKSRIIEINPAEVDDIMKEIEDIENRWERLIENAKSSEKKLEYSPNEYKKNNENTYLFYTNASDNIDKEESFRVMTSLRTVDNEVKLNITRPL